MDASTVNLETRGKYLYEFYIFHYNFHIFMQIGLLLHHVYLCIFGSLCRWALLTIKHFHNIYWTLLPPSCMVFLRYVWQVSRRAS